MKNYYWKKYTLTKLIVIFILLNALKTNAQEPKVDFTLFNGIAIIGYVDDGGFLNFTGPNVTLSSNESKFILGLLPSLRFKEDTKTPKNSFITPHLGFGLTYNYKLIAIQIPMYYNAKTATTNGKWNVGLGVGIRLDFFNKKK